MADLLMKNFTVLGRGELELVLSWRNVERVRQMMSRQDPITLEEHLEHVKRLPTLTDRRYYMAFVGDRPVGVIDITCMEPDRSSCNPGLYTGEGSPMGTGLLLELTAFNCAFDRFGFKAVWSFIKKENLKYSDALVRMFRMTRTDEGNGFFRQGFGVDIWREVGPALMKRTYARFKVSRVVWRDPEGETVSYPLA